MFTLVKCLWNRRKSSILGIPLESNKRQKLFLSVFAIKTNYFIKLLKEICVLASFYFNYLLNYSWTLILEVKIEGQSYDMPRIGARWGNCSIGQKIERSRWWLVKVKLSSKTAFLSSWNYWLKKICSTGMIRWFVIVWFFFEKISKLHECFFFLKF